MHHYRVIPTDPAYPPVDIFAHDPAAALIIVERMKCGEADVEYEGEYAFSLHLDSHGLWTIFNKHSGAQLNRAKHNDGRG